MEELIQKSMDVRGITNIEDKFNQILELEGDNFENGNFTSVEAEIQKIDLSSLSEKLEQLVSLLSISAKMLNEYIYKQKTKFQNGLEVNETTFQSKTEENFYIEDSETLLIGSFKDKKMQSGIKFYPKEGYFMKGTFNTKEFNGIIIDLSSNTLNLVFLSENNVLNIIKIKKTNESYNIKISLEDLTIKIQPYQKDENCLYKIERKEENGIIYFSKNPVLIQYDPNKKEYNVIFSYLKNLGCYISFKSLNSLAISKETKVKAFFKEFQYNNTIWMENEQMTFDQGNINLIFNGKGEYIQGDYKIEGLWEKGKLIEGKILQRTKPKCQEDSSWKTVYKGEFGDHKSKKDKSSEKENESSSLFKGSSNTEFKETKPIVFTGFSNEGFNKSQQNQIDSNNKVEFGFKENSFESNQQNQSDSKKKVEFSSILQFTIENKQQNNISNSNPQDQSDSNTQSLFKSKTMNQSSPFSNNVSNAKSEILFANNPNKSNPFASFGKNIPKQPYSNTASLQSNSNTSSIFGSKVENQPNSSTILFGSKVENQPNSNTNLFGSKVKNQPNSNTSNIFSSKVENQPNSNTNLFGSKVENQPNSNTSNIFSASLQSNSISFGSNPQQQPNSNTAKLFGTNPNQNIFSSLNLSSKDLFGGNTNNQENPFHFNKN